MVSLDLSRRLQRNARKNVSSKRKHRTFRPAFEGLEQRSLMTGFWQLLNPGNPTAGPPGVAETAAVMLLSNGEVLIQGGQVINGTLDLTNTQNWYRLTPDLTGNYVAGTWGSRSTKN